MADGRFLNVRRS